MTTYIATHPVMCLFAAALTGFTVGVWIVVSIIKSKPEYEQLEMERDQLENYVGQVEDDLESTRKANKLLVEEVNQLRQRAGLRGLSI